MNRANGKRYRYGLIWGLLLGVGLMGWAGSGFGRTKPGHDGEVGPRIIIRMHDYAGVKGDTVERAEKETARIFRKAGIETSWVECPVTHAELAQYPTCQQPPDAPRFDMNILPRFMATQLSQPDNTLGLTSFARKGERSFLASVFFDSITEEAERTNGSLAVILGYAMAHELGHLLLPTSGHSPDGVMRVCWTREDLRHAACGELVFTPQQGEQMRGEVRARAKELATAELASDAASK